MSIVSKKARVAEAINTRRVLGYVTCISFSTRCIVVADLRMTRHGLGRVFPIHVEVLAGFCVAEC